MKAVIGVLFMISSSLADTAGECDLAGFYMELGCSAAQSRDANTSARDPGACPDSFNCPELHPDPNMCYYKGVAYGDRATIPQSIVSDPCSQACRCETTPEPRFECAAVDCFETPDKDLQACVQTYELESCCSVGTVCGKDAILKLKTCEFEGQTYHEGESFEPKNTRKLCICTAQFNGTIDDSSCRDVNCGIEMHYQDRIMRNCAPVFAGNKRGCPIDFQCPTNTTSVVRGINPRNIAVPCTFGNTTLSVGDEVATEDKCTKCTCEVPPFVSCTRKMTSKAECIKDDIN